MCIMEVREGQHHSTIAQAEAHNLTTVVGDLVMLERVLHARGHEDKAAEVNDLRQATERLAEQALDLYSDLLSSEVWQDAPNLVKGKSYSDVFSLVNDIVHRDMKHAHVYETR